MELLPETENEWLETDGLGAFASGTSSGVRTRRYHNVLMIAACGYRWRTSQEGSCHRRRQAVDATGPAIFGAGRSGIQIHLYRRRLAARRGVSSRYRLALADRSVCGGMVQCKRQESKDRRRGENSFPVSLGSSSGKIRTWAHFRNCGRQFALPSSRLSVSSLVAVRVYSYSKVDRRVVVR